MMYCAFFYVLAECDQSYSLRSRQKLMRRLVRV